MVLYVNESIFRRNRQESADRTMNKFTNIFGKPSKINYQKKQSF